MGWLQKLTGREDAAHAGGWARRAAEVQLNAPDYAATMYANRQMAQQMGARQQGQLDFQYGQTYDQMQSGYKQSLAHLDQIYGQAQGLVDRSYTDQLANIDQGVTLNARALGSMSSNALGALSNQGGSLQARFAGINQLQQGMGQQLLQNRAQGFQARAGAAASYQGATAELGQSRGYNVGQLDINQVNALQRLGAQFAELGQSNNQFYAGFGEAAGQNQYGNMMQEAILRRAIEQEPMLARSNYYANESQRRLGMMSMGMNLGLAALMGPLGGAGAAAAGAAGNVASSMAGGMNNVAPGGYGVNLPMLQGSTQPATFSGWPR